MALRQPQSLDDNENERTVTAPTTRMSRTYITRADTKEYATYGFICVKFRNRQNDTVVKRGRK